MRLVQVKVENYKLINDSGAFRIGDPFAGDMLTRRAPTSR